MLKSFCEWAIAAEPVKVYSSSAFSIAVWKRGHNENRESDCLF